MFCSSLHLSFIIGKTLSRQRQQITERDLLSTFQNHDLPISINFADRPGGNQVISTLFFPVWLEPGHRYLWMLIQQPGQHPELPVQFCLDALVQLFLRLGQPPRLLKDRIVATQGCKGRKLRRPIMAGHLRVERGDMMG